MRSLALIAMLLFAGEASAAIRPEYDLFSTKEPAPKLEPVPERLTVADAIRNSLNQQQSNNPNVQQRVNVRRGVFRRR